MQTEDTDLRFPNAPIVEAIFNIEAPGIFDYKGGEFADRARPLIDSVVFSSDKPLIEAGITLTADQMTGETQSESESKFMGMEFRSNERSQVMQFRCDGFSFHQLSPYTSYETVIREVEKYWPEYLKMGKPKATIRQGLRFINRIQLPENVGFEDLGDYAKITPTFALKDELEPQNLLSRVQLRDPDTKNEAFVTFALADSSAKRLELIFDIDVASHQGFEVNDPELWSSFAELRGLKNRLFVGSLHKKCLDLFR